VELVQCLVLVSLNNSFHNVLVNTGSRSLRMDSGTPWSLTMVSKKALVTVVAEYEWPRVRKWVYLENWPATIRITDLPPTLGKPSTKLSAMSRHTLVGTANGCRRPTEWRWLVRTVVDEVMNQVVVARREEGDV
jgi:hypothetical protein